MPNRTIGFEKTEEMFAIWCQSNHNVAKTASKCRVSEHTVRKYVKKDKWLEREKSIHEEVRNQADFDRASADASRVRVIRGIIGASLNYWVAKLEEAQDTATKLSKQTGKPVRVQLEMDPMNLERFIKLERMITGTDQAEGGGEGGSQIQHEELSDVAKAGLKVLERHGSRFIKKFADELAS